MASIMEGMMTKLLQQQTSQFAQLLQEVKQSSGPSNMVDTRGIGRPPSFTGSEKEWREWKGKVTAYLYATAPFAKPFLDWAEMSLTVIDQNAMEAQCISDQGDVLTDRLNAMAHFSTRLGLILIDTCKGEPYRIVESAGHGNGLEAWRLLMRGYASRTPGTKRALLASLFSMKPATSAADLESVMLTVEEVIRRYDAMSVDKMPEDIQCAILIAVCPKELKEFLDMSTEDFKYAELRTRASNWIERKRDQHGKQIHDMERRQTTVPMDVSWFGEWDDESEYKDSEIQGVQDWGGYPSQPDDSLTHALSYVYNALKGKGKWGKGKKGKGHSLPGKGYSTGKGIGTQVIPGPGPFKGSSKGYSKGNPMGKGQFHGECHYCGKWGHVARDCKLKDVHMEQWRAATAM